jgi:hypothetical protein
VHRIVPYLKPENRIYRAHTIPAWAKVLEAGKKEMASASKVETVCRIRLSAPLGHFGFWPDFD